MRALVLLCLAAAGCTTVDGGAVELSWKLRPASSGISDKFIGCTPDASRFPAAGPVARIRLDWEVIGGMSGSDSWACDDNHGVTGFDLNAGAALLSISPECEGGPAVAGTFIAPAPTQRAVNVGDVVTLGAIELVINVSDCGAGAGEPDCICQR